MTVECPECDGTGAEKPGCYCCKGRRLIHWRTAIRHGFRKSDLRDLESDGYGYCPSCHGDECETCEGSGEVRDDYLSVERDRVLLAALTGSIPPRITERSYIPFGKRKPVSRVIIEEDALLSKAAGELCRKAGEIHWFRSIFSDHIDLTPKGRQEVARFFDDGTARFMTIELTEPAI